MSETNETIADISAELRSCPTSTALGGMVSLLCNRLADRIEAAWKREELRWATANGELARMIDLEKVQGYNAAAMSEALEAIRDEAYERIIDGLATDADWLYKTAKAALSSPPKNCDRFATVDKAMDDFADDALIEEWSALEAGKDRDMLAKELFMFAKWLFEPATERKGESDGK